MLPDNEPIKVINSVHVVQEDTACTRLDCCRHRHKLCLHNPNPRDGARFRLFGQVVRFSLPPGWLRSTQKRGTFSQILARRHTQTNTLQSFGFVTFVTNKKQTSIRCSNHTHNTHWVHLKCIHIQQRQYKPDWRCTIHTPTQNVTPPSTNNTPPHHK